MSILASLSSSFIDRCESIATEQRVYLRLRAFEPLPAQQLATQLGATLFTPETLPNADPEQVRILLSQGQWSAAIICMQPLSIVYNSQHSLPRQQSDLMHECAHVLLQHPMVGFNTETGLPQRKQQVEDEATYLGSCLQIPRRGLLWATQKKMNLTQIAEHFGASEKMVDFRSNLTGVRVTKQPQLPRTPDRRYN